jgi:arylsulfatase A-like enzyme
VATDTPVPLETSPDAKPASLATSTAAFPTLRYALLLTAPLALICIFAKVHKLLAAPEGDAASFLAALFPDLVFALVLFGVVFVALRFTRGPWRIAAGFVSHVAVLVLTLLVFVEHGFWLTTGAILDGYTLWYGLDQLDALGKVYLSEMGPAVWLGFAFVLALQLLPRLAWHRPAKSPAPAISPAGPHTLATPATPATRPLSLGVIGLVLLAPACTGVFALVSDVPDPVLPLTGNVVAEFAGDVLRSDDPSHPANAQHADALEDIPVVLAKATDKPRGNVIVIVLESLRASATSVYSPELDTTPFLLSLAAKGAVVEHAWPSVTHTSKALVGALCGIHPKLDVPIEEAEPTGLPVPCLARLLNQQGFDTAFMQTATAHFERRDQLVRNMDYTTFESKETLPSAGFEETSYFGWEDRALVKPALDWVAARKAPFFLTLLTLSTHHTYKTPSNFPKVKRTSGELDAYLNATSYLDTVLAELFAGLDALGRLDDTLIVLVGDHGEAFGEHGRFQHDSVIYEEGLHIPMVLVGPGVPAATRIAGNRHAIDIVPTVLEWVGTPVLSGLPGKSLLTTDGHDRVFAACWLRLRCMAVREGPLKYIWHFDRQGPEVFDLAKDPLEKANILASTPPEVASRLRDQVLAWKADNDLRWARFFANSHRDFVTTLPPAVGRPLDVVFSDVGTPTPDGDTPAARPLARLIGIDAPAFAVSGLPLTITLHWEVLSAPGPGWKIFTHLLGVSDGARPRLNADHVPVSGRHPVASWQPHTFISDPFRIFPEPKLPPGTYELVVGLWNETSKAPGIEARAIPALGSATNDGAVTLDPDRRAHVIRIEVKAPTPATPAN